MKAGCQVLLLKNIRDDIIEHRRVVQLAKRLPKASKRRLALLGPISLVLILYFLFTAGVYTYKLIDLSIEERELKQKLVSLQAEEDELKTEIQKLKDPDYLARYARENYLYSKDGEYIIKIDNPKEEEIKNDSFDQYYDYMIYGAAIAIIFVFIYIIVRNRKK